MQGVLSAGFRVAEVSGHDAVRGPLNLGVQVFCPQVDGRSSVYECVVFSKALSNIENYTSSRASENYCYYSHYRYKSLQSP